MFRHLGIIVVCVTLLACKQSCAARDDGPIDLALSVRAALEDGQYARMVHFDGQWYGSTYWAARDAARGGPDWCRVGNNWQHPGQHGPSVRSFQAPRDGRVTVSGRVYKLHLAGDGVRVIIRHGDRQLWQAEIEGADQKGVEPKLTLDVRKGDRLRFIVDKRKAIVCDTTFWDPVVTYADGTAYQASRGFSKKEGTGPWSYHRLADGKIEPTGVVVHAIGPDFTLREWALQAGTPLAIGPKDALPLMIVSLDPDRPGMVLGLDTAGPWSLQASLDARGSLRLQMTPADKATPVSNLARPYEGQWTAALAVLPSLRASMPQLARRLDEAYKGATAGLNRAPDMDLLLMAQSEWRRDDRIADTAEAYAKAAQDHLARALALAADLRDCSRTPAPSPPAPLPQGERGVVARLAELERSIKQPGLTLEQWRRLYLEVRLWKRAVALSNRLLTVGQVSNPSSDRLETCPTKLLFAKRVPTSYSHLVMQYFGWRARSGGGLFVLERPGYSLGARDILEGKLAGGNVLEPRLSYDGRRIVFSYVACRKEPYDPARLDQSVDEGFYHVYTVNVDGTDLRQVTAGPYDDLMPCWLPDGGIVFCSTRRRGHARCFGGQFSPRWHVYTLHRMDADGSNLRILSVHDTNEWFPSVTNAGLVLYGRWDYIDRDAVTHQNLWATRPDGTNPIAVWGNASPTPHCAFQAQPIPGSEKIIFTASAHHSITGGSIAIVDPKVSANDQAAIRRITPEIVFPEAEGRDIREYYGSPWPLSEKYFSLLPTALIRCCSSPRQTGLTRWGFTCWTRPGTASSSIATRRSGARRPSRCARLAPPVVSSMVAESTKRSRTGEMVLMDVYQGLGPVARGSIKQLRIVQIFPKTTNVANSPPIGLAREENARAILGTVPVEADGSARFKVPALTPVLFQALDADGMAYQTMRSLTYVQPGERVSCVGCHENRMSAPPPSSPALALRRPAARIAPGELGGRPFSYVEVVQPVLDRQCVRCHGGEKNAARPDLRGMPEGAYTRSYFALCNDRNFWGPGTNAENAAEALVPRFGGRNTIQVTPPGGMFGARGSRLIKILRTEPGHYGVKLTAGDLERLAAWIDLNAVFYGAYHAEDQARQLRGEHIEMPEVQ